MIGVRKISGQDVPLWVPDSYRQVARVSYYDAFWYAHWSIAPFVRAAFWLYNRRYAGHKLLARIGFLDGPEGSYYSALRWRWDFWNGSHSWAARRYIRANGLRAYRARYGTR